MSSVCQASILAKFDAAKSQNFELSKPELCEAVAQSLGTSKEDVERAISARDAHQQ